VTNVRQVRDHRFPSGLDWQLFQLNRRLSEIDALSSLEIEKWEEDGWGSARGLWLALKSGRVVLLRQLDYEIETGRAKGPVIVVDGDEAVKEGFATIAADVLANLGLDDSAVAWRPENLEKWSADAHDLLEWWRAR
jgi:hypothetical protein